MKYQYQNIVITGGGNNVFGSHNVIVNSSGGVMIGNVVGGRSTTINGSGVCGSGTVANESRTVDPFNAVAVMGPVNVEIVVGPERSVRVEADDNILGQIVTTASNLVLEIGVRGSFSTNHRILVKITTPTLTGIGNSGSGEVTAIGVETNTLQLNLQGSGDIGVAGHAEIVHASLQGSGDISTSELIASSVNVSIQGSGDIRVYAARALRASIQGSGDVRYSGDCTEIHTTIAGSGSCRRQRS